MHNTLDGHVSACVTNHTGLCLQLQQANCGWAGPFILVNQAMCSQLEDAAHRGMTAVPHMDMDKGLRNSLGSAVVVVKWLIPQLWQQRPEANQTVHSHPFCLTQNRWRARNTAPPFLPHAPCPTQCKQGIP